MLGLLDNNRAATTPFAQIDMRLKDTVSASRLNCWRQCGLKLSFRYVLKIPKPKTQALQHGSVVHLVLQQWNMMRWRLQAKEMIAMVMTRLRQVFDEGGKDQVNVDRDGEEEGQKTSAWAVSQQYFADTPIKPDEMPEAVEVPVETDLSKHDLSALISVLDLVRFGGRIVDFKSAAKTPNNATVLHQNGVQLPHLGQWTMG